ncbi:MAG: hypothetical protein HYZ75_08945 [Elusimicrobia bacterium]|nr:hypothetical protein [Elusimicrobiota bacterium]
MRSATLLVVLAAALPAQARQEFLPLTSPGFISDRPDSRSAFGFGGGYASYDGKGHSLSGPVFFWTLRQGIGKEWALFLGSDAAIMSGTSDGGPAGRIDMSVAGGSVRGMAGKAYAVGASKLTLAFGLVAPFTIANYPASFNVLTAGKRSSFTPDTAIALGLGVPITLVAEVPLGQSWTLRPHGLSTLWPGTGIFYAYKFLGPFTPRRTEGVGPYLTLEGGLAAFHRSGLGVTSRLQWTTSAGNTAATRGASVGLAYEFGFGTRM